MRKSSISLIIASTLTLQFTLLHAQDAQPHTFEQLKQTLSQIESQSRILRNQSNTINSSLSNIETEIKQIQSVAVTSTNTSSTTTISSTNQIQDPQYTYSYSLNKLVFKDLDEFGLRKKFNASLRRYKRAKTCRRKLTNTEFFESFKQNQIVLTFAIKNQSEEPLKFQGTVNLYRAKPNLNLTNQRPVAEQSFSTPIIKRNKSYQFRALVSEYDAHYCRYAEITTITAETE
ncbi:hypothetical protein KS4_08120 [Poriferisphaera corsica]|uniref:Uncharacterized protein n=1 Tax=Poriferisphaera corsica TaxID=2528020 RepID=A0A517YRC4_9BACT|nr:hypothetical protein [Poriferisphaera corsica]QDU32778.1 hypothetical protein KS4_08120 [Poriferisphaera corsica]